MSTKCFQVSHSKHESSANWVQISFGRQAAACYSIQYKMDRVLSCIALSCVGWTWKDSLKDMEGVFIGDPYHTWSHQAHARCLTGRPLVSLRVLHRHSFLKQPSEHPKFATDTHLSSFLHLSSCFGLAWLWIDRVFNCEQCCCGQVCVPLEAVPFQCRSRWHLRKTEMLSSRCASLWLTLQIANGIHTVDFLLSIPSQITSQGSELVSVK